MLSSTISATASSRKARISSAARFTFGNAARAQVEKRIRIEIADRCAMGALHIVGENFQLRLQIDSARSPSNRRLGGLPAVGAVGAFARR